MSSAWKDRATVTHPGGNAFMRLGRLLSINVARKHTKV